MYRTQTSVTSTAPPQTVFDTISDLRNHLDWSGERASSETFKLLSIDAPDGPAAVGTAFSSSGAADNGTFHDRSVVTAASSPTTFVIETDAHLDRKRGKPWDAHFSHRYDVTPEGRGSRITYTETIERVNYLPYWLQPWMRPIFKVYVNRADRRQLANLARLAEERSGTASS
jgi:hypothetical protein